MAVAYYQSGGAIQSVSVTWYIMLDQCKVWHESSPQFPPKRASDAFAAWFLLVLSFPFIAGSFATFIVTERESKAKHLQTVAGVQPSAYWLSTCKLLYVLV